MAHIERRGPKRWKARYRGPDGRERSQTFERKVDAENWLTGVEGDKLRQAWIDPSLARTSFEDWTVRWWETTARDSTMRIRAEGRHLAPPDPAVGEHVDHQEAHLAMNHSGQLDPHRRRFDEIAGLHRGLQAYYLLGAIMDMRACFGR